MRSRLESVTEKLEKYYNPIIDVSATISQESRNYRVDLLANVRRKTPKSSGKADRLRVFDHAPDQMWR